MQVNSMGAQLVQFVQFVQFADLYDKGINFDEVEI